MASELAYNPAHGSVAYAALSHQYPYAALDGAPGVTQGQTSSSAQAFSPGNVSQYQGAASGASGGSMQQNGSSFQFTSAPPAPYSRGLAAQQAFQQQQQQSLRHSASPQPPNANSPVHHPTPRTYPMAAPPLPNTPNSANNSNAAPSPISPQSPGAKSREQQRIDVLFDINVELLQEVNKLQNEGKGGAISPQQVQQAREQGKPDTMASEEYIQCLRRVQANLAYLMPKAQTDPAQQAKAPPGPAHMTAPSHMPQLEDKYKTLRELFPGWQGLDNRSAGLSAGPSASSPRPNTQNGMTAPSAGTPTA
ncbi:hypothetical protein CERZMDRAFT_98534 [Cercospora zeae-maydis SCOH1-5]|uniref:Uncharacterized protein n=1 Tax=Cercospora zeae-maydis SCOH1-5 TaxID=717836 RepID=A0A6A6FCT7_9PEZI|nr:hypothetical protein CERZMDRAFT_98534 [Cercospora zeae-maydis SCOH1-5]